MQSKRSIDDIVNARWSFTTNDAAGIIAIVGLPPALLREDFPDHLAGTDTGIADVLAWFLNETAVKLRWDEHRQSMPSPRQVQERAARIEALCSQLSAELVSADGDVFEGLGAGALFAFAALEDGDQGRQAVENAVREVARLQGWAGRLAKRKELEAKKKPPKRGRKKDHAWHDLIERLGGVYFHIWGKRPGVSRDPISAKPYGPFFNFVEGVTERLLPRTKTTEAIASALGEHRWPQWD